MTDQHPLQDSTLAFWVAVQLVIQLHR